MSDLPPSLKALFAGFFSVGMTGFGGVLPFIRRMVVERQSWLDAREFTDTLSLCQLLPGPNVTNFAVTLGQRHHGARGAVVAVAGLIAAPVVIVVMLGTALDRLDRFAVVGHTLGGLAAAAAGLVLATAIKIGLPLGVRVGWSRPVGLAIAAGVLAGMLGRLPLGPVLLIAAPLSLAAHAAARGR